MDIAGIGNIGIQNATISFAFGLGIVEISDKIYFNELTSTLLALRENAVWQKVGVMDVTLPILTTFDFGGIDLTINPIISITSPDLFTPDLPTMSIDLNLEDLIANGEDLIGSLLLKLTGGMIDISADGVSFSGGPFGEIQGILDKFGLDFNDLIAEFKGRYDVFKADLLTMDIEMQ
eukprot:scaffold143333_cov73-Cyclotella_meneghiniana.AAC.1